VCRLSRAYQIEAAALTRLRTLFCLLFFQMVKLKTIGLSYAALRKTLTPLAQPFISYRRQ
jgi:hypothetical protein